MRRPSPRLALSFVPLALGCASAAECVAWRTCGDARWLDDLALVDGAQVLAPAVTAAFAGQAPGRGEALPVSSRRAYVRFDLSGLAAAAGVERAVLSLAPHPSWRTGDRAARIVVRGVGSPWTPAGVAAGEGPAATDEVSVVRVPGGVRAPVRVDVTAIVRAWVARASSAEGVSIECDGAEAVFVGVGSAQVAARPRLEVVVR